MAAISLKQKPLVLAFVLYLSISATTSAFTSSAPSFPPSVNQPELLTYPTTLIASILSTLGFQELSSAAVDANLSTSTPITIFAPSDSSLLTCPSCSLPLLLQEHAVPGLYPNHFLRNLAFGTKLETLASEHCLTITSSAAQNVSTRVVFVNGVEISEPDLFNNGVFLIHGLRGFVSHLSPLSCNVERMTTLSFPQPWLHKSPLSSIMRLMLKDAIIRLRFGGYSIVSLALKVKFGELSELKSMTVFALDDISIFSGAGYAYLHHFRFHVVPNRRLMAADLLSLQAATTLPTMEIGQNLVVTAAGGGGQFSPVKINYVKVTTMDLLHNSRIVVHAVSTAFPRMHHHLSLTDGAAVEEAYRPPCDISLDGGFCEVAAPVPAGIRSTSDIIGRLDDRDGL
ncbi:fasciclin-like arabinogalactan protein 21 [Coffea arabica]|uniref:Fasciclin-like arabinogalactan protein 21 n=1 Tax=Coffea arabica TaxID=13443 RepID=A0A6P6W3Z2_COFAR